METNIESSESPQIGLQQEEEFELKIVDCGTNYVAQDLPSCLSCFCGSGCFCGS